MTDTPLDARQNRLGNIQAITFDFWGTLYDNGPDLTPRYLDILVAAIPGAASDLLPPALDRAQKAAGDVGRMGFRLSVPARVAVLLDHLNTTLASRDRDRLVNALETVTLDHSPHPVEGAREVVEALHRGGYSLAVISDTGMAPGRVIRQVMERDGLGNFFDHCSFSDEVGVNKHFPQPFLSTCLTLGLIPSQALHVGDLPETDIRVAKAAGLRTALATYVSHRHDGSYDAYIVLSKPTDLLSALARPGGSIS